MIILKIETTGDEVQVYTDKGTMQIGAENMLFRAKNSKTWKGPIPIDRLASIADFFMVPETKQSEQL